MSKIDTVLSVELVCWGILKVLGKLTSKKSEPQDNWPKVTAYSPNGEQILETECQLSEVDSFVETIKNEIPGATVRVHMDCNA